LFGDWASTFQDEVLNNLTWGQNNLVSFGWPLNRKKVVPLKAPVLLLTLPASRRSEQLPSTDETVKAGYAATYRVGADIVKSRVGQVELLLGLTGTALGGDDSLAIQAGECARWRAWKRKNDVEN
jgi:hypothetical protein